MIVSIPDLPGYYASTEGQVFSVKVRGSAVRLNEQLREMVPTLRDDRFRAPYPTAFIAGKRRVLHRLILRTFRGPPPSEMVARHLDGNPNNNCIDNLVWGTQTENMADMRGHGRFRPRGRLPKSKRGVQ